MSGREVDAQAWGALVLEDVLYRAALDLSASGPSHDAVVDLAIRVTADPARRAIILTMSDATGSDIATALVHPFGGS